MKSYHKIVIIGATSAIAEQCARLWAQAQPAEMLLVGRNPEKLAIVSEDLQVRAPNTTISTQTCGFTDPEKIQAFVDAVWEQGVVDLVLIAHGTLPLQEDCQQRLGDNHAALTINGLSPVLFAEAFVTRMQANNQGTVAIIGSVAGDRGRKSNYVYGAAKGLVSRYAEGMQHRLAISQSAVKMVLIKPGPTDTPMTADLKQSGAGLAPVDSVAKNIVDGVAKGKSVIYAPSKWRIMMMIITHLPRFLFNKMDI